MQVRLGSAQVCPRLLQLLVHFRRFYLRQKLPLLHVRANVRVPHFQIPVRRWSVTLGISVARFSAEPTKNAILRASSARNSCARTGAPAAVIVRLFMFSSCAPLL